MREVMSRAVKNADEFVEGRVVSWVVGVSVAGMLDVFCYDLSFAVRRFAYA